jgi:hypothetical protein
MPSLKAVVAEGLEREGFGVKGADGGVIAHLGSRTPSRHEIVDAVPELDGVPMDTVEEGVFVQVEEEPFSV